MVPSSRSAPSANSGHTPDDVPSTPPLHLVQRIPVPPELLGRASVPRLLALTAAQWGCIVLCWAGLARWPAAAPLFVLLIAGRLHSFGVLLHDAIHMPWHHKSPGLRLLEVFAGYPLALTLESMRYHHLRHHRDAGLPEDPYRRPPASPWRQALVWLLVSPILVLWVLRGPLGVVALFVPRLRTLYGRLFLQERFGRDLTHDAEVHACTRADVGQVLVHLGVLAAALRWPREVGLGYGLPFLLTSGLCAWRLLAEHTACQVHGRTLRDVLACTSDHGLGWVGQLFTAPFNVGYHVVHHLHPQVALQHLPRLRDWYLARYPDLYPRPRRP